MKKLFFAVILLSGSITLASPQVGDYVQYDIQTVRDGIVKSMRMEYELTGMVGDSFERKQSYSSGNVHYTSKSLVKPDQIMGDQQIEDTLTNCAQHGGVTEMLSVAGKYLQTCKLPLSDAQGQVSYSIFAKIPFGLVEFTMSTSEFQITWKVKESRRGN